MPENDNARIIGAGPQFLETLGIPVVAGRAFSSRDVAGAPAVAVINERYAGQFFPRQNPIGRHLVSNLMGRPADLEVVGVVRNTIASGLRRQPPPMVYVSFAQFGDRLSPQLAIRAGGATAGVAEAVRAALQAQLPSTPVEVRPLVSQITATVVQERMLATVATGFGVLALVLSSVGLYGLLAYGVAQRSREIGIRMALGATASGVILIVVLRGIRLVAAGVVLGCPAVWLASRAVASMLFGLKPADPSTLVSAIVLLASAALVASYVPARRASRIDPLRALNCE
jgi:ABC-type antimicrobial peptide transport system permease subunit